MSAQDPFKSNHRKIYDFLKNYEMFHALFSRKSPKPYRTWRILTSILSICFFIPMALTIHLNVQIWNVVFIIAFFSAFCSFLWLIRKATKLSLTNFDTLTFKKMYELEVYIKSVLKLNKEEREKIADICFNLSEKYRRNYYKLEIPLSIIGFAIAILMVIKDISFEHASALTFVFACITFALWNFVGLTLTSLDLRSKRYLDGYELIADMKANKQYKKMKKLYLERIKED